MAHIQYVRFPMLERGREGGMRRRTFVSCRMDVCLSRCRAAALNLFAFSLPGSDMHTQAACISSTRNVQNEQGDGRIAVGPLHGVRATTFSARVNFGRLLSSVMCIRASALRRGGRKGTDSSVNGSIVPSVGRVPVCFMVVECLLGRPAFLHFFISCPCF